MTGLAIYEEVSRTMLALYNIFMLYFLFPDLWCAHTYLENNKMNCDTVKTRSLFSPVYSLTPVLLFRVFFVIYFICRFLY